MHKTTIIQQPLDRDTFVRPLDRSFTSRFSSVICLRWKALTTDVGQIGYCGVSIIIRPRAVFGSPVF